MEILTEIFLWCAIKQDKYCGEQVKSRLMKSGVAATADEFMMAIKSWFQLLKLLN